MLQITTDLFKKTFYGLSTGKVLTNDQSPETRSAFFRDRKLFQLEVNYRWSPIVIDERFCEGEESKYGAYGAEGHDLRAGDRAPDAPGLTQLFAKGEHSSVSRFFDLFRPSLHTALVFCPDSLTDDIVPLLEPLHQVGDEVFQIAAVLPKKANMTKPSVDFLNFVFHDTDGHAFTGYGLNGVEGPMIVIVRPDGMIGSFASGALAVNKYIKSILKST